MSTAIIVFVLCLAFLLGNLYLLKDLGTTKSNKKQKNKVKGKDRKDDEPEAS